MPTDLGLDRIKELAFELLVGLELLAGAEELALEFDWPEEAGSELA